MSVVRCRCGVNIQYGSLVCSFCREADYDLYPEVDELSAEELIEIELKKIERAKKKLKKKEDSNK